MLPPPLLFVAAAAIMLALPGVPLWPLWPPSASQLLAAVPAGLGLLLAVSAVLALRQAQTQIDPRHPERSRVLVTHGIYRLSRNPMYLSLLLTLLALSIWRQSPSTLLPLLAFVLAIRVQIRREEQALARLFGIHFTRYCQRTRRWI